MAAADEIRVPIARPKLATAASNTECDLRATCCTRRAHAAPAQNRIVTSKYTVVSFLPKSLWEQFRRAANVYFLLISVLQLTTGLSPTNEYSTVVPLIGVVLLSMIKEGYEDWQRHADDSRQNNRKCQVLRQSVVRGHPARGSRPAGEANHCDSEQRRMAWDQTSWENVCPGDMLLLRSGDEIPCDCVLLSTSQPKTGVVYVSTSQLDGESALKPREVPDTGFEFGKSVSRLGRLRGHAACDHPSAALDDFSGSLHLVQLTQKSKNAGSENAVTDIGMQQTRRTSDQQDQPEVLPSGVSRSSRPSAAPGTAVDEVGADGIIGEAQTPDPERGQFRGRVSLAWGDKGQTAGDEAEASAGQDQTPSGASSVVASFRANHTLLRGSAVRNTRWCVALAIHTGSRTKLALNSSSAPSKRSKLDAVVDSAVTIVFVCLLGLVLLCGSTSRTWSVANRGSGDSYLPFLSESSALSTRVGQLVTFLILLNNLVPISLSVTLELVKWCQARRIEQASLNGPFGDQAGHTGQGKGGDTHGDPVKPGIVARTSNLSEDLGCVTHVLCDKTGTLTENRMQMVACCIAGSVFGRWGKGNPAGLADGAVAGDEPDGGEQACPHEAVAFRSRELVQRLHQLQQTRSGSSSPEVAPCAADAQAQAMASASVSPPLGSLNRSFVASAELDFMRALSLCSTVLPSSAHSAAYHSRHAQAAKIVGIAASGKAGAETSQDSQSAPLRSSTVSQEGNRAGDTTQNNEGVTGDDPSQWYQGTSPDEVALAIGARVMGMGLLERKGKVVVVAAREGRSKEQWEVLAINAFSSQRARMSVLVWNKQEDRYVLLCKGSDQAMFKRCSKERGDTGAVETTKLTREQVNRFANTGLRTLVLARKELSESRALSWLERFRQASAMHGAAREYQLNRAAEYIESGLELLGAAAIEDRLQRGVPRVLERLRRAGCRVWMLTGDKQQTAVSVSLSSKLLSSQMRRFVIDGDSFEECWEQLAQARAELRSLQMWSPGSLTKGLAVVVEGKALEHLLDTGGNGADSGDALAAYIEKDRQAHGQKTRSHKGVGRQKRALVKSILPSSANSFQSGAGSTTSLQKPPRGGGPIRSQMDNRGSMSSAPMEVESVASDEMDGLVTSLRPSRSSVPDSTPAAPPPEWHSTYITTASSVSSETSGSVYSAVTYDEDRSWGRGKDEWHEGMCQCGPPDDPATWCLHLFACTTLDSGLGGTHARRARYRCRCMGIECAVCPTVLTTSGFGRLSAVHGAPQASIGRILEQLFCPPVLHDADTVGIGAAQQESLLQSDPWDQSSSPSSNGSRRTGVANQIMELLEQCEAVVACRLTPSQKAWLASKVRARDPSATCLAVGDGGNDVGMIQSAHLGVGISGNEGRQAVNAADFAIAEFSFLEQLILVHGRQNYRRVSLVVLYSFYKNFVLVFTLLFFSFENGSSGTTLFESFLGTGWNVAFTAFPVIVAGVLDEDVMCSLAPRIPEIYRPRSSGEVFASGRLLLWAGNGVWHAFVAYVVARMMIMAQPSDPHGLDGGLLFDGTAINMAIVAIVSGKLLLEVHSISMLLLLSIGVSAFLWLLFVSVYQHMYAWTEVDAFRDFEGIGSRVLATPSVWLNSGASVAAAWIVDFALAAWQRQSYPTLAQVSEECLQLGQAKGIDDVTQGMEESQGRSSQFADLAMAMQVPKRAVRSEKEPSVASAGSGGGSITSFQSKDDIEPSVSGLQHLLSNSDDAQIPLTFNEHRGGMADGTTDEVRSLDDADAEVEHQHREQMNLLRAVTGSARRDLKLVLWLEQQVGQEEPLSDAVLARTRALTNIDRASLAVRTRNGALKHRTGGSSASRSSTDQQLASLSDATQESQTGAGSNIAAETSNAVSPSEKRRPLQRKGSVIDLSTLVAHDNGAGGHSGAPASSSWSMAWAHDTELEEVFRTEYWIPKAVVISRIALIAMCLLASMYIALELLGGTASRTSVTVRSALLLLGILLAAASFLPQFRLYYTAIVMLATIAGTIGTSLVIDDSGVFGQTLYQLGVFLVVRLPFVWQVVASAVGLIVWVISASNQTVSTAYVAEGGTTGAVFEIVLYLAFVIGFSALGARNLHAAMRGDFLEQRRLSREREAFQTVLGSMLPSHVIAKLEQQSLGLKVWGGMYWEHEPDVTVVFCDVADFDTAMEQRTPHHLVQLLDRLYTLLDALCEKHGVTKMETVGKTWMGAAGLHGQRGNHAARAIFFGLDVINTVSQLRDDDGTQLIKFRVGVNTGEAVAGVVGLKKPQFCLFGDTVNTASRMQSSGQAGRVHISSSSHTAVADLFEFEHREIEVKSKGLMSTYFVGRPVESGDVQFMRFAQSAAGSDGTLGETQYGASTAASIGCWCISSAARASKKGATTPTTASKQKAAKESLTDSLWEVVAGFADARLEKRFQNEQVGANRAASARSFIFVCLFHVFRLMDALFIQANERQSSRFVAWRAVGLVVSAAMLLVLRVRARSNDSSGWSSTRSVKMAVSVCLGALAVVTSAAESLAWRVSLDLIFLFAVASHGGLLDVVESGITSLICAVVFFIVSGAIARGQYSAPEGSPLDVTVAFFCLAGLAVIMVAALSEEVYVRRRFCRKMEARAETRRIHSILFKMLPRQIVEQLKEGRKTHGQVYPNVTLLFMDIAGFTKMSQAISPSQVVQLLNSLFSDYDRLTAKHGAFKVQTIGDAYVACAGLPYADADVDFSFQDDNEWCSSSEDEEGRGGGGGGNQEGGTAAGGKDRRGRSMYSTAAKHAAATLGVFGLQGPQYAEEEVERASSSLLGRAATMRGRFASTRSIRRRAVAEAVGRPTTRDNALSMLALAQEMHKVSKRIKNPATGKSIQVRIGLHTGTIVGGVIGTKTLRFDIWGPHVMAGNAMESNGIPGQTVASSLTKHVICSGSNHRLRFDRHKDVDIQGIGTLGTYVVRRAVGRTQQESGSKGAAQT